MRHHYVKTVSMLLIVISAAHAAIWYVHPDSTLNSIQTALDACGTNDTVLVGSGIYYENIVWPSTQGIDLTSEYGTDTTIIDGSLVTSAVKISTAVDSTTIIHGFTIQNGRYIDGGGIYCSQNACPLVDGNLIINNATTQDDGGGICCIQCAPIIRDNTITGNTAFRYGGGIGCRAASPIIIDNLIDGNTASAGGGIGLFTNSSPNIIGNSITNNSASGVGGGGIACYVSCSPLIRHNTIFSNVGNIGAGIACRQLCNPHIDSCNIIGNTGDGIYCDYISNPVVNYNNICDNAGYGVCNLDSVVMVDAENNWWDDPSGPGGAGPGIGDSVNQWVDFDPWLTQPGAREQQQLSITDQEPAIMVPTILSGTILPFTISQRSSICIRLFNITGRECWSAERATYESGSHTLNLPKFAAGIYFLWCKIDHQKEVHKILFIR